MQSAASYARSARRVLCALLLGIGLARGEDGGQVMEEVVVSTLREAPLQTVASSITQIDRAAIERLAVQHFEELTRLVPNLNWSGEGSRARYFQMRGIGELEQYEGAPNPSVGFLVDDIDFSGIGGAATLFDMDRVEVLRGPQGTRFGANALAGLIYLRTADASPDQPAFLEATAGDDDTRAVGAAMGAAVPGTDGTVALRAALQKYESDGFRSNQFIDSDNTNRRDEFTGRLKLRWLPGDNWQTDLALHYLDLDNGYDAFAIDNGFRTYSDRPGDDAQLTRAGSLRAAGDISPALRLVSISSVSLSNIDFNFDADWGNDDFWARDEFANATYDYYSATDRDRDSFTQELRFLSGPEGALFGGRVNWVAGSYFQRLNENNDVVNFGRDDFTPDTSGGSPECLFPPYLTLVPGPPARCRQDFDSRYQADSLAAFGELELELGPRTMLRFGLRREWRDASYRDSNGRDDSPTDSLSGGDLSLSHSFSEQIDAYAKVARGFRAGGFNINPAIPEDLVRFDDESLWNYELGLRASATDGRWDAKLSLFWQEREDMQLRIPFQDSLGDPVAFTFLTQNAESGSNRGAELDGSLAVTDTVRLRAMLGLLATDVDQFDYDPELEGRDQAHAPAYSFSVGALWQGPGGWFADLELAGRDRFYFDFSHDEQSAAYEVLNLRVGRDWGRWSLTAWARNLTDEEYAVRGFFFGNEPPAFPDKLYLRLGDPRQLGVTLRYQL